MTRNGPGATVLQKLRARPLDGIGCCWQAESLSCCRRERHLFFSSRDQEAKKFMSKSHDSMGAPHRVSQEELVAEFKRAKIRTWQRNRSARTGGAILPAVLTDDLLGRWRNEIGPVWRRFPQMNSRLPRPIPQQHQWMDGERESKHTCGQKPSVWLGGPGTSFLCHNRIEPRICPE